MPTRGLNNCNPGNIRHGPAWQGLAKVQHDKDFATFVSDEMGIRAMAKTLLTYQDVHGLTTLAGIIARWAPPEENDTKAYTKAVCVSCLVKPDEDVDLHKPGNLHAVIVAIIRYEQGVQPYEAATINRGMALAGVA